jgi:hypothetical protein
VRLSPTRPTDSAWEIFTCACNEAAELSFAVGVEHLLLAVAVLGDTLDDFGADAETIRDLIRARERDALAMLGISIDSVREELDETIGRHVLSEPCGLPVAPEAKRLLELAARRRSRVTPDQMLATLVTSSHTARRLLVELDVPVATLRDRLTR